MLKRLGLCCIFLLASLLATGQTPYFKQYQVRDGLPSNNVYFVFQDSKGYVWLCTDVGVSRFDGAHFTNFTTADGLTDNEVFTCFEDSEARIWFATLNGKPCYFHQGKIHSGKNVPLLRDFDLQGLLIHIFQEETGELVMASNKYLGKVDWAKNKAEKWQVEEGTFQIWDEPKATIGLAASSKIGYMQAGRFTQTVSLPKVSLPVKHDQTGDTLYVVFARKLLIYSLLQHSVLQSVDLPSSMVEAISVSVHGNRLWIGDRKGAYLFDRQSLKLKAAYLSQSQVSTTLEDREGGWWFSTLEHGVFYVPTPEIMQYVPTINGQSKRINCLVPDSSGRLWLGMMENTYGILNGQTLQLVQDYPKQLKPRAINSIRHLPGGTTLVAGKSGVLAYAGGKRRFYRLRSSDANIDRTGALWIGLTGVFKLDKPIIANYELNEDKVTESPEPAYYLQNPPKKIREIRVDKIVFDNENTAWLASPMGLFRCKDDQLSKPVLPFPTRDLLWDETAKLLWALTESNGLYLLRNGQLLDSISIRSGQGQTLCRSFCADKEGNHWLATAKGLFKVEGKPGALLLLDYSNFYGMGTEKLNAVAVVDGKVYLGKDDVLMSIPTSLFGKEMPPPPIYISSLLANGDEVAVSENHFFKGGENAITIGFEGLAFKDFKRLQYRYRLIGHDDDWHTTTNEAVEYASLRPDHYVFEVVAVNSAGVESASPARLRFTIAKPFWMQWWFLVASFAVLAGLVWLWVKQRERKLRRKFEMRQQLMTAENEKLELQKKNADLKMLALRLQMNPHFIFNALNTIKGYYGQDKITEANSYIAKFARLLRLNLDHSDTYIPLEQEIELLKIYMQLSQIRYPDKMDYHIEVAADLVPSFVLIPSMVIQPFVENAVIHGVVGKEGRGNINLFFNKLSDEEIEVTVRDNGIGRKAAAMKNKLRDPHKPLATAITEERLILLRNNREKPAIEFNDIYDENGAAAGTEVVVRLPIQQNKAT